MSTPGETEPDRTHWPPDVEVIRCGVEWLWQACPSLISSGQLDGAVAGSVRLRGGGTHYSL